MHQQTEAQEVAVNFDQFKSLVRRMREAQCRYWRDRTQAHLIEAKKLEEAVDNVLLGKSLFPEVEPPDD